MREAVEQATNIVHRGRLRGVAEPAQPGELARGARGEQAVEPRQRVRIEPGNQHLVGEPFGPGASTAEHRFEHER